VHYNLCDFCTEKQIIIIIIIPILPYDGSSRIHYYIHSILIIHLSPPLGDQADLTLRGGLKSAKVVHKKTIKKKLLININSAIIYTSTNTTP